MFTQLGLEFRVPTNLFIRTAVEGIETEEDVATGDGDLPLALTLTRESEVPIPSVMPRPERIPLRPAVMGPPTVLGGTGIGIVVEALTHPHSVQRGKDSKRRASRTCQQRCQKHGGQNAADVYLLPL
jgi:hypothetical protein